MQTVKIKGMSCQHCIASVTKALEEIGGISNIQVDLETGMVQFDGSLSDESLEQAITQIGFEVVK